MIGEVKVPTLSFKIPTLSQKPREGWGTHFHCGFWSASGFFLARERT